LLAAAAGRLADKGRLCILSFHSLEDRLVKDAFRSWENPCTCPRDFPQCVCGAVPLGKSVTKRPMTASQDELNENPRSRSAKLRAFERVIS
jgi:16S rRNA (cytosine1402-N4)-methyltransferase